MSDGNGKVFTPQFIYQIATWGIAQILAGCMLYVAITNRMTTVEVKVAVHDGTISDVKKTSDSNHDLAIRYEERLGFVLAQQNQERAERLASYGELKAWIDTTNNKVATLQSARK